MLFSLSRNDFCYVVINMLKGIVFIDKTVVSLNNRGNANEYLQGHLR